MNALSPLGTDAVSVTLPHSTDLRDSRRFANPVCAYQRGFEDCRYERSYCNPFPVGGREYRQYEIGFRDGRQNEVTR
jgi:hypothetical protein